jgi:putative ABC transport system permease protein
VRRASNVYSGQFELRRSVLTLGAVAPGDLASTINVSIVSGRGAAALAAGELLIDTTTANREHLAVGSVLPARFAETGPTSLRIGGIYKPNALLGSYLCGDAFFLAHFSTSSSLPIALLIRTTGGATPATTAALTTGLAAYPNLKVQTRAEFEQTEQAQVNQLLGLVYALLFLAVLIALIGIVNTLMLSVFERTREIGLLRAVGMRRRQVRAMVRSEGVILSLFGALIGIVVGTLLGVALSDSLKDQGITELVVPLSSLVVFLVLSGLLGLAAASWPARRAARLNVLEAIATD